MRVLICTTGGLGHLLPLRPLARALGSHGHQVAWVTAPDALAALDGQGFRLMAAGPTFEASRKQFRAKHAGQTRLAGQDLSAFTFPRLFGAVLAPAMLDGVEHAVRAWEPDLLVHEPAALAAPLVCRHLGIRQVVHGYGLRPPRQAIQDAMTYLEPLWNAKGLEAPVGAGLDNGLQIDIAPPSLQPGLAPTGGQVVSCNVYGAGVSSAGLDPARPAMARQTPSMRRPCIYVTFGTVFNRSAAFLVAAQTAARLGGSVVVTVGADGDPAPFQSLGAHVRVHRFVDQAALLPQCDLVVSHGGAGTVLAAAAHGVAQLVLPQAADHFRNAHALQAAHAGRALEPERQDMASVAAAMAHLLDDAAVSAAARAIAREMSDMPSPADVATRLFSGPPRSP